MRVKELRVDPGPVAKRFRARAFGRAATIRRRTSHVTLVIESAGVGTVRARAAEPAVRTATAEDLRGSEAARRHTSENPPQPRVRKSAPVGFIRRVFQRKVV